MMLYRLSIDDMYVIGPHRKALTIKIVWAGSDIKSIDQRILSVTQKKKIDRPSHLSLKYTNFYLI